MPAQTALQSWKNRLSDSFTQVANKFRGNSTLETNRYAYTLITPFSYTVGQNWMTATPTLSDPSTYTISKMSEKEMKTTYAYDRKKIHNIKMMDDSGLPKLFSLTEVLQEFDKFHTDMTQKIKEDPSVNVKNYRLCA